MSYGDPEEVRSLARSRTAGTGSAMGIDRGVANTIATSEGSYDRDLPSLGVVVRHTLECLRCLLDEARELGCVGLPGALRCISMSESGEHGLKDGVSNLHTCSETNLIAIAGIGRGLWAPIARTSRGTCTGACDFSAD